MDFITHSIEDGTLYFTVRFKDKTDFSLRYACDMFVVGADFCDFKTYFAVSCGGAPIGHPQGVHRAAKEARFNNLAGAYIPALQGEVLSPHG